jgi:hypothetical protein
MREFRSPDSRLRKEWAEQLSIFTREGSSELLRQAHRTDEALASLRRSTSARGDRLVVALAPASFQLDSQTLGSTLGLVGLNPELATPDAPSQALIRILQKQGIESCDLLPALAQAHQQGRTLHFPHDGHWTPEGHEVVAQALAGCLAL